MPSLHEVNGFSKTHWNGRRVFFEILENEREVICAISEGALEDIAERRYSKPKDFLNCFQTSRCRIEAVARKKYRARPLGVSGVVSLWAEDFDDTTPDQEPAQVAVSRR